MRPKGPDLGVYAEVSRWPKNPGAGARGRQGIIISGGPSSVYDPGSPTVDPAIYSPQANPVVGICYGVAAHGASSGRFQVRAKAREASTDSPNSILTGSDETIDSLCSRGFGGRQQISG